MVRGVRGATTVAQDQKSVILQETARLLRDMCAQNTIDPDDIASILFTMTPDLVSEFPAVAAREMGFSDVPLICAVELAVSDSLPRCIRILIHWNTDKSATDICHVYLNDAVTLRPDKARS